MNIGEILRFGGVGGIATLVHMAVGTGLITIGVAPLLANIGAFLVAFGVSFLGHHKITFAANGRNPRRAFLRFALVALIGFAINESLLALLLWISPLAPQIALLVSTACAAASTYILSRNWAFAGQSDDN
ncbi:MULTISPECIES: GtrA family protein [Halocynthiibacter]|uniref:GtrA family protein n=1 Tax=Halocynthiibacter halioticoli TaxID=2986804 RepID=A0AAE3IYA9_9RHOB|nr:MULTISPECIES: GtrA family protein [Halocynthiibacter]MCV6823984.1 GtrA family protein [Halocynthiibacter halioticoli]MCW4056985.1 GtrA family protein [Halocynthiibacter sp. SDUM655004]